MTIIKRFLSGAVELEDSCMSGYLCGYYQESCGSKYRKTSSFIGERVTHHNYIKREPKTFLRKLKLIILDEISRQRSCF